MLSDSHVDQSLFFILSEISTAYDKCMIVITVCLTLMVYFIIDLARSKKGPEDNPLLEPAKNIIIIIHLPFCTNHTFLYLAPKCTVTWGVNTYIDWFSSS